MIPFSQNGARQKIAAMFRTSLPENVDKFVAVAFPRVPLGSTDFNRLAVSA